MDTWKITPWKMTPEKMTQNAVLALKHYRKNKDGTAWTVDRPGSPGMKSNLNF